MKQKLMFKVTVEKSNEDWAVSETFESYEAAQDWRYKKEATLLKENPSRTNVRSNLIFVRVTD